MINSVINYGSSCKLINIGLFRKHLLILITLSSSFCERSIMVITMMIMMIVQLKEDV
jgi:hypothetical protein